MPTAAAILPFAEPVLAGLASTVLILWGTAVWVPRVVTRYGIAYFDWREPWIPGFVARSLAVAAQAAVTAALAVGVPHAAWPFAALMAVALNGVFQADARFLLIPDRFQIVGAVGACGHLLLAQPLDPARLVLHAASGPGLALLLWLFASVYERLRGRDALGFGDVKLIAWLGLAFGPAIGPILLGAMLLAVLAVVPTLLLRRRSLHTTFAFGPFIVLGVALQLAFLR